MAPPQKPGKSKQDYSTPDDFMRAVNNLLSRVFGSYIAVDLAADATNTKASVWFTEADDSLGHSWEGVGAMDGWCWLNPPFGNIKPWAKKCAEEGIRVALLVPMGVQDWYVEYVRPNAYIFELHGRLSFDGKDPYPKDCILALFGTPLRGSTVWDWRKWT